MALVARQQPQDRVAVQRTEQNVRDEVRVEVSALFAVGPGVAADPPAGLVGRRVATLSEDAFAEFVVADLAWLAEVPDGEVRARSKGVGIMADGRAGSVVYDDVIVRDGRGWHLRHRKVAARRTPLGGVSR
jgi:hypothetical protein